MFSFLLASDNMIPHSRAFQIPVSIVINLLGRNDRDGARSEMECYVHSSGIKDLPGNHIIIVYHWPWVRGKGVLDREGLIWSHKKAQPGALGRLGDRSLGVKEYVRENVCVCVWGGGCLNIEK